MKAKQRKIMREQIEKTIDCLKYIAKDGNFTKCFEGFPKEEYVDLLATHCILLTVDSAIKFVNFNEQESHVLYKLKNDLQKRYDAFNFIYLEKLDQWTNKNKNGE
jgi:hypothetical protein